MARVQITIDNNLVTEVTKDGVTMKKISMANLMMSDAALDAAVANDEITQAEKDRIAKFKELHDHDWDHTIVMEYIPGTCVKINGVMHWT